jgi:hypothetical protein
MFLNGPARRPAAYPWLHAMLNYVSGFLGKKTSYLTYYLFIYNKPRRGQFVILSQVTTFPSNIINICIMNVRLGFFLIINILSRDRSFGF